MKVLYYDCFCGISGDMNLAAMIDIGVPESYLLDELKKLNISGYSLGSKNAIKMGISGTQVNVELQNNHDHSHAHSHGHKHDHEHRTFSKIKQIITDSELSEDIKITSIKIFEKVAEAEGKIHNKPSEEVHFHEVGAIDSIVDIVGAAICYHYLKPDKVLASTIELGGGFVNCAHGRFPVPAPATIEILKNIPIKKGAVNFETTTPTGAAILATLVDEYSDIPALKILKTSYGIGHRDLEIPNVLRIHFAESNENIKVETSRMLECNIDDMPGEQFEYIIDQLLFEGAQDVFLTPVIMKKSRPATKISVLCSFEIEQKMKNILFRESTTIGMRCYNVDKFVLERKIETIATAYGKIDIKIGYLDGNEMKYKPEFEQCRKLAIENNVPLKKIIDAALDEFKNLRNE